MPIGTRCVCIACKQVYPDSSCPVNLRAPGEPTGRHLSELPADRMIVQPPASN